MLEEVLAALRPQPAGMYVDCTYGRGGHTRALLAALGADGRVLAIDKDAEAVAHGRALARADRRLTVVSGSFETLDRHAEAAGFGQRVDGVLLDLGVSSTQLEDPARGFSFQSNGPLDMRMDPGGGQSAAEWLMSAPEQEIARVLWTYGEERNARRIARAIARERRHAPIYTTARLAEVVAMAKPAGRRPRRHPATKTFQAIRIAVNRELEVLEVALEKAVEVLAAGGRLAVISFHSLEDRIVKRFIRRCSETSTAPVRGLPVEPTTTKAILRPVGRARRPSDAEVARNPRARSATLRVAEKCT